MPSGPIPGENYTSDTKNYPWHQPPEYTDISDALDKMVEKITAPGPAKQILALAEVGTPLYRIAGMVVMQGVSHGKWTVDLGLLMIGPVTKVIEIMCETMGIGYTTGLDDEEEEIPHPSHFKMMAERKMNLNKGKSILNAVNNELPEIKQEAEQQEAPEEDLQDVGFAKMQSGGQEV